MSHYGALAELVSGTASLAAAGAAVTTTFKGRATWLPPEEVVPSGVARTAGLTTSVVVAVLWSYRTALGMDRLAALTILGLALTVVALAVAIRVNIRHAYYYPAKRTEKNRRLGGSRLTEEAERIHREHAHTLQMLLEDAQGDKDLVWTRSSQAWVSVTSTLSFIVLIAAGSCTMAAAGLLVASQVAASAQ